MVQLLYIRKESHFQEVTTEMQISSVFWLLPFKYMRVGPLEKVVNAIFANAHSQKCVLTIAKTDSYTITLYGSRGPAFNNKNFFLSKQVLKKCRLIEQPI